MNVDTPTAVSTADWRAAQARTIAQRKLACLIAAVVVPLVGVAAMVLGEFLGDGPWRFVLTAACLAALVVPLVVIAFRRIGADQHSSGQLVETLTSQLSNAVDVAEQQAARRELQADRQEFETRLANALDMAAGEPEVIDVIERSFSTILPSSPVELLLADNSHAHLTQMASSPTGSTGCGVDSPDHCPAARRAQVQRFTNSDALDACPKLRGRSQGVVSAVCMPVSIMGRTVGVIHSTAPADSRFADDTVLDLGTLSKLAGARIGLLRVMAETTLQAATDSLTGLLNRRSFEAQVAKARSETQLLSVAMADLDHFKALNDTYGHETGDRALRLFSQVLAGSVRKQDLVCRQGGEEFVVALMGCTGETARTVLDAVRSRLEAAITVAGLPAFTVSFGLVDSHGQEDLPALIHRADVALFQAKREGRNRVVRHDHNAATVNAVERPTANNADRNPAGNGDVSRILEQPSRPRVG